MAIAREMIRFQQEAIMACFNNIGNISNNIDGIFRDVQRLRHRSCEQNVPSSIPR